MSGLVLDHLAAVVARRAEHAAIEQEGVALSYTALWAWAGAIGAELRRLGVGEGDRVAITAPKSAAFVAAILGVWWAGAAFVAAGEELPRGRQRVILEEAAPRVTLDLESIEARRGVSGGEGEAWARVGPEALAYVAFTSGSGGRPKGVMVAQRGLVGMLRAQIDLFDMSEETRSFFYLSTAFDAAISDIGTALLAGGTLVIEAGAARLGGAGLLAALERLRISCVDLPPALLPGLDPSLLRVDASLRTIVIGGEVCPAAAVRAWADRARVVSVYGPTEATVCASAVVCERGWSRPLLGEPLPGVVLRVVEGELWIGGHGVAIGYLGRPELDVERFVSIEGARFYRTGDRVRVGSQGELEFVGRVDRQVKIGGVRIELDEVEARLAALSGILEAAVIMTRTGRPGPVAGSLVAFVVAAEPASPPSESWLRGQLSRDLPAAAIPRRFCWRGALPRGVSGKIDREALAAGLEEEGAAEVTGWTGAAGALAAIWTRVLGRAPVAAEQSFVEAGGDSLSALEMVAAASACGLGLNGVELLSGAGFGELVAGIEAKGAELRASAELLGAVDAAAASLGARARGAGGGRGDGEGAWLITGATGFVGGALLGELLARGASGLVCLVRASSVESAYSRLAAALELHERALDRGRVAVVLGDLERRRFGADAGAWQGLCERVEVIVHSGARVHLIEGFEALAPTNVGGTVEALRLAMEAKRRPRVALISTLSCFVSAEPAVAAAREADDRSGVQFLVGGYAQSKWAAEALLRRFSPPLPALCVRLGLVTGSSTSGRTGPREQLSMFLRGLAALGAAPEGMEGLLINVTPVDFVAAALAELLGRGRAAGIETVHVAGRRGATGAALVAALRAEGVAIEVVGPAEFLARGAEASGRSAAAAMAYLSLCRRLPGAPAGLRGYDLFLATGVEFEVNERLAARCPAADEALLRRYVRAALAEEVV